MLDSLRTAAGDYRRTPAAIPAAAAPLVVPAVFLAGATLVVELARSLIPFGLLALALVAQIGRLTSAPANAVVEALLAGERTHEAVETARGRAAERVAAAAVERVAVVAGTVVVGTAVVTASLALATAGGYALAAAGVVAPQNSFTVLLVVTIGLVGVGAGVGAPLRIGTSLAGDVAATRATAAAIAVARRRPRGTTALIVLRVVPWAVVLLAVAAELLVRTGPPVETTLLVAPVVVAAVATPLAVGLERRMAASMPSPTSPPSVTSMLPGRRVLLAGVVVLAAVATPTIAVRVSDSRPSLGPSGAVAATDSAESVVATAGDATRRTNHYENATAWAYNDTTGRMEPTLSVDRGWDGDDRRAVLVPDPHVAGNPPGMGPIFYGDGTVAFGYDVPFSGPFGGSVVYDAGRWTVVSVPGESLGMTDDGGPERRLEGVGVDADEVPWRVLSRGNDSVVVGVERPERLAGPFGVDADDVAADSHVRLTVDAHTGRPRTLSVNRNVTDEGDRRHLRTVVDYGEWETYDLRRPEPIRNPTAPELFWDALGY
ncbi:hypothetical protein [Halorarum salinum]|uniref:Uncharacterized protein n=1 Tax=Halorarum salinum TaxID=2743089 RepID=A0A7D5LAY4_9EURY|nr:hypothetical protein [Halobaculum salinum]QLG62248.1 hypothetical protein HUG12_11115 [Halobaculum salinum]